MANQLFVALPRVTDANGAPASGALVRFYRAGTTTPLIVYTDDDLTTPHATPITADAGGVVPAVFFDGSTAAKAVVTDAADAALYTIEDVMTTIGGASQAEFVTFSPVTGNAASNVQSAIENVTTGLDSKIDGSVTISAGAGLVGGGDLSANRIFAIDFKDEDDMASDSDTHAPTQQSVKAYTTASIAAAQIGAGQTLQNVAASRVVSTTYTNSTGRPIWVSITGTGSGTAVQISSDGSTWRRIGILDSQGLSVNFPVPAGWRYRVNGAATIADWIEIRT